MTQNTSSSMKKLQWQCRRGMLELDVILIPFLNGHYESLSSDDKEIFSRFLNEADPDLYTWIMGFGQCGNKEYKDIIETIRNVMSIA